MSDLQVRRRVLVDTISVPSAPAPIPLSEGPACQVRCSEGRDYRVRRIILDYPFRFAGHDERALRPRSAGPVCRGSIARGPSSKQNADICLNTGGYR